MRRTILTAFFATACSLSATPVKIHGYITDLASPRSFEIDDYRITRDDSVVFDLDKGDYPDAIFRPEDLRIGTEVEIQGECNESTHELHATAVKVFFNDNLRVKRSAVVEHAAVLQREGNAWSGVIHADGQTIKVDGQTRFALKESQTNQLTPGLSIRYEGRRERDGSIAASKLEIFSNEAGRAELRMWREIKPKLNSNGEISIRNAHYKLVPDAEAQSYVQRIGAKLVPAFFRQDISVGAARQIPFQFYLIENPDFNAHAFPNGTVLVNSGVFRVLANEAQLAAVLGHEIAHATQEHAVRDMQNQKKGGGAALREKGYAGVDPLSNVYSRGLENQADRVGLEYMVAAGYDPRQAPEVWRQVAKAGEQKIYWNGQDDVASRRSYLLAEIRNNYEGVDFQSYVRDREEFAVLAERFGNTSIVRNAPGAPAETSTSARPGFQERRPTVPSNPQQTYGSNALTITTDPEGADVVLNGRVIGKTPLILPTGSVGMPFIITLQKAGFRTWTGQLVSVPGRTSLRIDMLPGR